MGRSPWSCAPYPTPRVEQLGSPAEIWVLPCEHPVPCQRLAIAGSQLVCLQPLRRLLTNTSQR
eukprot:4176830-Alexandrium_andersonii.AAC.1